jgi:hypothetical protein
MVNARKLPNIHIMCCCVTMKSPDEIYGVIKETEDFYAVGGCYMEIEGIQIFAAFD